MNYTYQPINIATAELRDIAKNHPCEFRRFHAARLLGAEFGQALPPNPFDTYTTEQLRAEFQKAACSCMVLAGAIDYEIKERRKEQEQIHGDFKSDTPANFNLRKEEEEIAATQVAAAAVVVSEDQYAMGAL